MMVLFYLISDLYFCVLMFFLSIFSALLLVFSFKNQLFFLFCFPYFLSTGAITFLFTSPISTFSAYFLLFYISFFLFYPIVLLVFALIVFMPALFVSTVQRVLRQSFLYFILFLFLGGILWRCVPVFIFWLALTVQPPNYRVMRFVFDFSLNSWLTFCLLLLFGFLFLFIVIILMSYFIWLDTFSSYVFLYRFVFFFLLFTLLVVCVPYDFLLHFFLFIINSFVFELAVLLRSIQCGYRGRVA